MRVRARAGLALNKLSTSQEASKLCTVVALVAYTCLSELPTYTTLPPLPSAGEDRTPPPDAKLQRLAPVAASMAGRLLSHCDVHHRAITA